MPTPRRLPARSVLLAMLLTLALGLGAGQALAVDDVGLDDLVITPDDNVVLQWNAAALQAVRETAPAPAGGGAGAGHHPHRHVRRLGRL